MFDYSKRELVQIDEVLQIKKLAQIEFFVDEKQIYTIFKLM